MPRELNGASKGRARSSASRATAQSHQSRSLVQASLADLFEPLRRFSRTHPGALIGGALLAGLTLSHITRARGGHSANRDVNNGGGRHPGSRHGQWRDTVVASKGAKLKELSAERPSFAAPPLVRATAAIARPPQGRAATRLISDTNASPSSATDVSVSSSNYGGGSEPGAISTGSS